jgi:hypothetical protein
MTRTTLLMLALGVVAGAVQAQAPARTPAPKPTPAPAATPAPAQDRADIDRTQIIGNRELPKVLYIVPWKKPLPGDLAGRPGGGVLDEALAPVDRDVFRRQVQYDAQLQAPKAGATPAAAPARP